MFAFGRTRTCDLLIRSLSRLKTLGDTGGQGETKLRFYHVLGAVGETGRERERHGVVVGKGFSEYGKPSGVTAGCPYSPSFREEGPSRKLRGLKRAGAVRPRPDDKVADAYNYTLGGRTDFGVSLSFRHLPNRGIHAADTGAGCSCFPWALLLNR